ncbi:MAG TPA: prepilin-type N-terminal cleavage/methylation domain-containing protein [Candidatus Paceibacterota bacterium]|nr:prepilin-type N-terminal cleavage/methylation domain-containing protein [Candidatus Paceibacterota bacterium]
MTKKNASKGFTLIEILIVIGIIAILAAIVIVAINPAKQFAQARNTQRESNINTILNAVGQNIADHKGVFSCNGEEADISGSPSPIGNGTPDGTYVDLEDADCLVPTYMPSMVFDPIGDAVDTLYTIEVDGNGRYTVCAPEGATPNEPALGDLEPATLCVTR